MIHIRKFGYDAIWVMFSNPVTHIVFFSFTIPIPRFLRRYPKSIFVAMHPKTKLPCALFQTQEKAREFDRDYRKEYGEPLLFTSIYLDQPPQFIGEHFTFKETE